MQTKQIHAPESAWETIAIGLVLIATGAILLGGDYLGVLSLDNVRNFWPLALIAVGLVDLKTSGERRG
jgi:hypothetical protein